MVIARNLNELKFIDLQNNIKRNRNLFQLKENKGLNGNKSLIDFGFKYDNKKIRCLNCSTENVIKINNINYCVNCGFQW